MSRRQRPRSRWGRVFQRGRTWYVRFRWPRGGREHVRAVGPSREEAAKILLAVEATLKNGVALREVLAQFFVDCTSARLTFREASKLYLKDAQHRKRPQTLGSEKPRIHVIQRATWAGLPLVEVTPSHVERWLHSIRESRDLSGPTLNRYMSAASCVFQWAGRQGHCDRRFNPVREIDRFPESSGSEVFLTPTELEAWIDAAPCHFGLLARFYARTGVRRDEARLLRWRTLDLQRGIVRIEAEVAKNHQAREIELTPDLKGALKDLRSQAALALGHLPHGDDSVFTVKGKPWTTHRIRRAFAKTVVAAGDKIPAEKSKALRLHDIRHTVGAILASNGVPLEVIAKVLGHKNLQTTRRYAHLYPSVISQAAKVLATAIPTSQPDKLAERAGEELVPHLVPPLHRYEPA